MAFTVETGSGVTDANSYASVADADSYASDRGYASWGSLTNPDKQAALIEASFYIDAQFQFVGNKVKYTQGLSWPRALAYDVSEQVDIPSNVIPIAVKRAAMELAVKKASGTVLLEDLAYGGAVKSEQAGPVAVTYKDDSPNTTLYMITGLLKGLLNPKDPAYAPNVQSPSYASDQYFGPGQFDNNGSGLSTGGS